MVFFSSSPWHPAHCNGTQHTQWWTINHSCKCISTNSTRRKIFILVSQVMSIVTEREKISFHRKCVKNQSNGFSTMRPVWRRFWVACRPRYNAYSMVPINQMRQTFFSMLKNYECDWLNVIRKKHLFLLLFTVFIGFFSGMFHTENIFVRLQAIFNFHVSMIATFSYQLNASFWNCDRIQRTIKCKLLLIDWLRCERTTVHFFLLIQDYWKYNGFNRIHP